MKVLLKLWLELRQSYSWYKRKTPPPPPPKCRQAARRDREQNNIHLPECSGGHPLLLCSLGNAGDLVLSFALKLTLGFTHTSRFASNWILEKVICKIQDTSFSCLSFCTCSGYFCCLSSWASGSPVLRYGSLLSSPWLWSKTSRTGRTGIICEQKHVVRDSRNSNKASKKGIAVFISSQGK